MDPLSSVPVLSPVAAEAELPFWSAPFGLAVLEAARLMPGQRFLDVGCGAGFPALELAARLGPLGRGMGLDPSREALDLAAARAEARKVQTVQWREGRAECLPFEDGAFDLVVSVNGLNNAQDRLQAVRECARVLERRGQLVFAANLPGTFQLFYGYLDGLLEECGLEPVRQAVRDHIAARRPSLDYWMDAVEAAGLVIRKVEERSFLWTFLDGKALLDHAFIARNFRPAWEALLPEGFLPFLQGRLDRLALERGGLRLEVPYFCLDAVK